MQLFNFYLTFPDATNNDLKSNEVIKWEEAKFLDLTVKAPDDTLSNSNIYRDLIFENVNIKLLRREIALSNIEKDVKSPRFTIEAEHNNSDLQPAMYEGNAN